MIITKNQELLAAANEKVRLMNSEDKGLRGNIIAALLCVVVAFGVFMFVKQKIGF
jgi:hypothetical protein